MEKGKQTIPPLIKKNVFFLMAAFACFFVGFEVGFPLFAKATLEISGKVELAGFPLTIVALGTLFFSIPLGKMSDKFGRKLPTIFCTLVMGLGLVIIAWGFSMKSWYLYLLGFATIGVGLSGSALFVLAVTDMFPKERKGEASGTALLAMYSGLIIGPLLGGMFADLLGFTYAFLLGGLIAALGLIFLLLVRPDPLKIATDIEKYYPEIEQRKLAEEKKELKARTMARIFSLYPIQVQFWARILAHAPRLFSIIVIPIVLTEAGYSMTLIGVLLMVLGVGALVMSLPIGRLADKYGRKKMIFSGTLISMLAILGEVYTMNIILLVIIFLAIGFGFAVMNNIAPTMVADVTNPVERGKSMGLFGIAGA
ncbi:MAG: MFS transporter, partial [Syntrophales bacterium]|nr:MFS transporter [Syntrophales bacterium]